MFGIIRRDQLLQRGGIIQVVQSHGDEAVGIAIMIGKGEIFSGGDRVRLRQLLERLSLPERSVSREMQSLHRQRVSHHERIWCR